MIALNRIRGLLHAAGLLVAVQAAFAAKPVPPPEGTLVVETTPPQALVSVDRVERGQSPATLRLAPGEHVVSASLDGRATARKSVRIEDGETFTLSLDLPALTGLALVESEPAGAEVTIDGVLYGKTPCLVTDLPLGAYQASFKLGGFRETTLQLPLKDRSPVRIRADLVSNTATVNVTTPIDDADVEVKVNGVIRGVAPCVIDRIPAGDVVIEASAPGYKPYVQVAKLGEAESLDVEIRLEINPASLKVVSLPEGARVYFDNNFKGETPLSLENVEPGEHRVRVEKDGHDPLSRNVKLDRGMEATEEFRLKSNTGSLAVMTEPDGVMVFVDGVKAGETEPADTKGVSLQLDIPGLSAGTHSVKFVKPGFFERTEELEIVRGETLSKRIVLKRRFIPDYEVVTATGSHKGVLISIANGVIRIEASPGVTKTYQVGDVISHGKIK